MIEFIKAATPWVTIGLCIIVLCVTHIRNKKKGKAAECNYMTEGMCLGLCVATAINKEWMALGVLVGMVIGTLIKKNKD